MTRQGKKGMAVWVWCDFVQVRWSRLSLSSILPSLTHTTPPPTLHPPLRLWTRHPTKRGSYIHLHDAQTQPKLGSTPSTTGAHLDYREWLLATTTASFKAEVNLQVHTLG